jgi:hypothetical protein
MQQRRLLDAQVDEGPEIHDDLHLAGHFMRRKIHEGDDAFCMTGFG